MPNIQIIDGAENCTYEIFAATEEEFELIFGDGQEVIFIEDIMVRGDQEQLDSAFTAIWARPLEKTRVDGIHGTILYEQYHKKEYFPDGRWHRSAPPSSFRSPHVTPAAG